VTKKNQQGSPRPASMLSLTVQTVDKQVLLPVGTEVSPDILDTLIATNNDDKYQYHQLMEFDTIKEDLLTFLDVGAYQKIFSIPKLLDDVLGEMSAVNLPDPILKSLNYFKVHDDYSYRHFLVVFALSTLLARDIICDSTDRISLAETGPVHDIGKICIPLEILKKDTPLSKSEKSMLTDHTTARYVLLSYYFRNSEALACSVARDHHERRDGSGYPRGIELSDLMVEIIVVCDVYDALISNRPYRATSYDNRSALEVISEMVEQGTLNIDVVKALVSHNRVDKPHYTKTSLSTEKRGVEPEGNLYGITIEDE
jgi:HD-GYP domain-containing protein (c-di-GMP phosphodiesterase class II)